MSPHVHMNTASQSVSEGQNWPPSVRKLLSEYYPDYSPHYFRDLLIRSLAPSMHVLEIGAGSGRNNQNHFELRGLCARYVGVDPEQAVLSNPHLDEGHQASAESLPFEDNSFDLIFHNFVAEHFPDPLACNREIARVLKPAGLLLFQTPNRFYYSCIAASLTPDWFHKFYVKRFGSGRSQNEVFSTFYRLNDTKTISTQLSACGFQYEIQNHSIPPGYLRFHKYAFLLGTLYERTLERRFPNLRSKIIVIARKVPAH